MSIPEEQIMSHLDNLLTSSKPGATLQYLHMVVAPMGPLGLPDESKAEVFIYAIVPDESSEATMDFVRKTIVSAALDHSQHKRVPLFAGLSHEFWSVMKDDADEMAERLSKEGRLCEHPAAVELTTVYAACRDGRRYQSARYLTGPKAGETHDVRTWIGPICQSEGWGLSTSPLVRRLVGLIE